MRSACCARGGPPRRGACSSACLAERADFVWLYLLRGFAQEELQAWGAADADFQKASQMPLDDNARYVLVGQSRGSARPARAIRMTPSPTSKSAIERKPGAYQAYVNLAQAYRRLDKLDLALDQLNRAVAARAGAGPPLSPASAASPRAQRTGAGTRSILTRRSSAKTTNSPYQVDDHVERGPSVAVRAGSMPRRSNRSTRHWRSQKDHALGQRLRAETLFRLGRFDEVVKAFDRYLETGKPQESVYRGRGLARAELGNTQARSRILRRPSSCTPPRPCRRIGAGRTWSSTRPKLALRDFELAIELDPKNGDAYNGRGFVRAGMGRYREAAQDAADGHPPWAGIAAIALQCRADLRPVPEPLP